MSWAQRGNRLLTEFHDQLFLGEERERELEDLYEKGVVDSMNRTDQQPADGDAQGDSAEATAVNKQTSDTLMAGEKVMEALDIADADRQIMQDYEETVSKLSSVQAAAVPQPTRHAVLAAYEMDGPSYVLKVVQAVQSTALHDALLVLPFSKVVSLMHYLNEWAIRVSPTPLPTSQKLTIMSSRNSTLPSSPASSSSS